MIRLHRDFVAVALAWGLLAGGGTAKEPDKFVVHEWGTFSTFSGSNGSQLQFTPDDQGLPDFVYTGEGTNSSIAVSVFPDGKVNFHVSGKVEASTDLEDMRLQRLLGHLPALAVRRRNRGAARQ